MNTMPAKTPFVLPMTLLLVLALTIAGCSDEVVSSLDKPVDASPTEETPPPSSRETVLWELEEWALQNPSYSGNPFDLVATVTFEHRGSDKTHVTEMFYDGDDTWRFRFTGTKTGTWTFTSTSDDSDLNGYSGTITVLDNPSPDARGFITNIGNKWAWQKGDGTAEAFVPHYRMAFEEGRPLNDFTDRLIEDKLSLYIDTEGFNGLFIFMAAAWADATGPNEHRWTNTPNRNPSIDSFDAVERVIQALHARGAALHLWYVGDCGRRQCAQAGYGDNGATTEGERRLLRYIAARLGPLPGWVMGYGYDNNEHVRTSALDGWGSYLRGKLGWNHVVGARDQNQTLQKYTFWPDADWRSKGEYFNFVPYSDVRTQMEFSTEKPLSFDERWWKGRATEEEMRRQLWALNMAGGASGIFGWPGFPGIDPFPNPNWFKTFSTFWDGRFSANLVPDNSITNGYALADGNNDQYIVYSEDASSINVNLSGMAGPHPAVAVDAKAAYQEIDLGTLEATNQTITLPSTSDWAIAIGTF